MGPLRDHLGLQVKLMFLNKLARMGLVFSLTQINLCHSGLASVVRRLMKLFFFRLSKYFSTFSFILSQKNPSFSEALVLQRHPTPETQI